ncbi:MAG: hypothetical protein L0H96_24700 [Humibacillus sp.]|nr:hypothetical protein [Humibacillus sp.]MDN5780083.1 hypothetical protein [Humibacillus sp.]
MTGPQLEALEVDLLTTAQGTTCPSCGTSSARCRVWAGGPGHEPGMHDARVSLAQQALTRELVDLVTAPDSAAVELTMPIPGSTHGQQVQPGRRHQEVSAA